jgi:hypothetical protein
MIKKLNWLANDDMTHAPNCVKNFNKLMQIFKQIIFPKYFY